MTSLFQRLIFAVAFAASALCASAANFDLGRNGDLFIDVPSSWRVKTRMIDGRGYEFTLTPANGANARALISLLTLPTPQPIDQGALDRELTLIGERYVKGSVEKRITLQPYKLREGSGVYTIFTDMSLVGQPEKKGDYKVMAPGLLQLTDSIKIVATLFTDDATGPEFAAMKAMTESIRLTPPPAP